MCLTIILEHYKEYRTEQNLFTKIQHYGEIYRLKQIYNEIIDCNYNCNTSVFNIYYFVFL